jgi:hypothetical protein
MSSSRWMDHSEGTCHVFSFDLKIERVIRSWAILEHQSIGHGAVGAAILMLTTTRV